MSDLVVYSSEEIQLLRDTYGKGATEQEFALMLQLAKTYDLDPFTRQIWLVKYPGSSAQIFAGRDGYLAIAHKSGQFDGMESGCKRNDDGDLVGWCSVYRKDMSRPFHVEVLLSEYNTKKSLWASKPTTMIVKVAEAQALRKAFSISGLYSPEEFDDAPQQQARQIKDVTPPKQALVCDVCNVALKDDDKLAKIREYSSRDMCQACFMEWYAQQQEGAAE